MGVVSVVYFCFFKQKTAYEMRISDWSSDVCSSDLGGDRRDVGHAVLPEIGGQRRRPAVAELAGELAARLVADAVLQGLDASQRQIGRASCRERVGQYV